MSSADHRGSERRPPPEDPWGPPPADLAAIERARREWRARVGPGPGGTPELAPSAISDPPPEPLAEVEPPRPALPTVAVEPAGVAPVPERVLARPRSMVHSAVRTMLLTAASVVVVAVVVVVATALRSGSDGPEVTGADALPAIDVGDGDTIVATATADVVELAVRSDGDPVDELSSPSPLGAPVVMVVLPPVSGDMVEVIAPLPGQPRRFVARDQVELSRHDSRIVIDRAAGRLELIEGEEVVVAADVVLGPEPIESTTTYVVALVEAPVADGPFGSHVFVLADEPFHPDSFVTGTDLVGIHGGGGDAGAVVLAPEDLARLVGRVPLGTPVQVRGGQDPAGT